MIVEDTIVVGGVVSCNWRPGVIRRNYIHYPVGNGSILLRETVAGSIVSDNIVSGGSWVAGNLGGTISGNVFISLPTDGNPVMNYTHEQLFGVRDGSVVERNILIGASYGAIMGIGQGNAANSLIRNNTVNMFGSGDGVILHMTSPAPTGIIVRSNLFVSAHSGINDEHSLPDAFGYIDYNLYTTGIVKRYFNPILITGKLPGDAGFDKFALPAGAQTITPGDVVVNPNFGWPFPHTDEEMLSGQVSFATALDEYRTAYAPKPGSPAIDAADPLDAADPAVTDGKCDIGAVEYVSPPPATCTTWRTANFTGTDLTNNTISGPNADPDGAGLTNYTRYAFGLTARGRVANPAALGSINSGGQNFLTLTFNRRATATDLSYIVEASTDLNIWTAIPGLLYAPGDGPVTAQDVVATSIATRRFLRIRIAKP